MAPAATKRKVSLTLDEDLVVALQEDPRTLSAVVNDAVRKHVRHMQQQQALRELLERLDQENGPLDSPEDRANIARFDELFDAVG